MPTLDHTFPITYRHRVHFTRQAFAPENPLLRQLLLESSPALPEAHPTPKLLAVVDGGLARARPHLLGEICDYFAGTSTPLHLAAPPLIIEGGESCKNGWGCAGQLLEAIDRHHVDRHGYLLAVGGGAVLDMAGFAAAIAHRGCRHVRLPSTTLAQADSGVGVKNGLNLFGKKNFAGTFAPPWAVVNDFELLKSLPPRDRRGGLAEAVKVSLIRDRAFFEWLETNAAPLAALQAPALEEAVRRCATLHVHHIATRGDPFELGSARPLDFGHWSAHKLEQLSDFALRHGEAVAIGVALDTLYSRQSGWLSPADAQRILTLLRRLGFTLFTPELRHAGLTRGIEEFREHLGGQLTLTFIHGIGEGFETHAFDPALLPPCLHELEHPQ